MKYLPRFIRKWSRSRECRSVVIKLIRLYPHIEERLGAYEALEDALNVKYGWDTHPEE